MTISHINRSYIIICFRISMVLKVYLSYFLKKQGIIIIILSLISIYIAVILLCDFILYILHGYTNIVFSSWLLIFKAMPNLGITLTL